MMQYDVKSAFTTGDAAMVTQPVRIKGAYVSVTTGGSNPVIFYDNASAASGTVLLKLGVTAAGAHTVVIPGEGVRCYTSIYATLTNIASVTVFYG